MVHPLSRVLPALLFLTPCALAQGVVTSPPGYLAKEGSYRSSNLGTLPAFRAQIVDGEYRGKLRVVTEIGFRQESAPYSSLNAARSWTSVDLKVADGDFATMTNVFSQNLLSTPTAVFAGKVDWPATPVVQTVPQAWESKLAFPFKTAAIFNGTRDILYDFTFTGGVLANAQNWGRMPVEYYLDSYVDADQVPADTRSHTAGPGCVDSQATWTQSAWVQLVATAYGPGWSTPSWRNMLRFSLQAFRTGPNASVVHVLDFAGVPGGASFPGITCQKLFIPVSPAALLYTTTASSSGLGNIVYPSGTSNGLVPYQPVFAGFKFWTQAAWDDTGNGSLLLTDAVEATLPFLPSGRTKHRISMSTTSTATSGNGPFDSNFYNQIIRLR